MTKELQSKTAHGHYQRVRWTPDGLEFQTHGVDSLWEKGNPDEHGVVRAVEYCMEPNCFDTVCKQKLFVTSIPGWWKDR
jgi:hypothetical protein